MHPRGTRKPARSMRIVASMNEAPLIGVEVSRRLSYIDPIGALTGRLRWTVYRIIEEELVYDKGSRDSRAERKERQAASRRKGLVEPRDGLRERALVPCLHLRQAQIGAACEPVRSPCKRVSQTGSPAGTSARTHLCSPRTRARHNPPSPPARGRSPPPPCAAPG